MIKHSAILKNRVVYVGKRHHDCIRIMNECGIEKPNTDAIQGFVTDEGVFLDRIQAATHALNCGQIQALKFHKTELFSEDLY